MPGTRKLGRTTDHRMSMLRGQVTYLLEKGRIETTVTRAKEVKALTDKMITLGKSGTLAAKRQAMTFITKEDVVKKLFDVVAPTFTDKNGGYTRVLRIGPRRGDAAEMALVEVIGFEPKPEEDKKAKKPAKASKKEDKKEDAKEEKKAEKPEASEEAQA
ncbi:MAG: 50S ribosomal protein L17 [Clostridia bacterium]|nr:50S ribosomal protein L17 [Clostridia bacterium]